MTYATRKQDTPGWIVIAMLLLVIPSSIWSGYVLSVLWAWFIVPTFEAPLLSVPVAIGLALTVNYLTRHTAQNSSESRDPLYLFAYALGQAILNPLFALTFGAIVRMFI